MCFHVSCYFTLYVNQVHPAQRKHFIFKCTCQSPVNHIGGMLISPDSYDNQKLWCNSQLYPTVLSAEIISFTRDAPSSFSLMKFLTDPALSVAIIFFFS